MCSSLGSRPDNRINKYRRYGLQVKPFEPDKMLDVIRNIAESN